MKRILHLFYLPLLALMLSAMTSCSVGDEPAATTEYDLVGIWTDNDSHILELNDPDHFYEYDLSQYGDEKYWVKMRLMYFLEPSSYLMLREDDEGVMHVYKVMGISPDEMTICWVATPPVADLDGESKLEIFKIFFNKEYETDPAKYETYRRITPQERDRMIGDIPLIEP